MPDATSNKSALAIFRKIAFAEGISYLALGITMPLKYWAEMPLPNKIVGMIHGVLFLLYIVLLIVVAYQYKWSLLRTALGFIASLLPFGTFIADKKVYLNENL